MKVLLHQIWGPVGLIFLALLCIYIVASHLQRGSVVTVAVGQINGGLSDCGPIQIHLIDTRILDLEWAATIYTWWALMHHFLSVWM